MLSFVVLANRALLKLSDGLPGDTLKLVRDDRIPGFVGIPLVCVAIVPVAVGLTVDKAFRFCGA